MLKINVLACFILSVLLQLLYPSPAIAHLASPFTGIKPFPSLKPSLISLNAINMESKSVDVIAQKDSSKKKGRNHQIVTFFSGGIAGTIASTLTMPLEVIKTQLQASTRGNKKALSVFSEIFNKDGPRGFFRGLQPMLIGIIPTRAIYFWAYSTTKDFLKQTSIGDSALNHLLSAFSAGITSNTVSASPFLQIQSFHCNSSLCFRLQTLFG